VADSKEVLINSMLGNIDSSYDKSEGTFFYDVIMPVAIEMEKLSKQADAILTKGFADTATGKDLDRIVSEVGIVRKRATKATGIATIGGINGSKIVAGEKISSDSINFTFLENKKTENNTIDVLVECEIYGTDGNVPAGAIKYFPKTLQGLQTVTNKEAFVNGYNEEDDEALRERYYIKVRTPATSGNIYHYKQWCLETTGVGNCRIIPLWNGNGTVKCILINANKKGADKTLIDSVKENIENNRPIGATVTVISALEKEINITFNLTIEESYNIENIKKSIENSIIEYLKDIAFNKTYVSLAKVGAFILDTDGVVDYTELKLNGTANNIQIGNEEVAILGQVVING
jgi:uncharacterized phage protein gp47/JayE